MNRRRKREKERVKKRREKRLKIDRERERKRVAAVFFPIFSIFYELSSSSNSFFFVFVLPCTFISIKFFAQLFSFLFLSENHFQNFIF